MNSFLGQGEERRAVMLDITCDSDGAIDHYVDGQGIEKTGSRIIIDGIAPDGTPEALTIEDAPGFAMAVQWHPEYRATEDSVSTMLFAAFGEALRIWRQNATLTAD